MRKPRILKDGAWYHVTARANRKELIMNSRSMKDLFLDVLSRAKKKYDFRVENFCIMGNHFHLMIKPNTGESLSSIMQWIMSVFAMMWNRIHNYCRHVWGDRFFSRIIPNLREFIQVFKYIDDNPVKAGLIKDPRKWKHCGLWHRQIGIGDIIDKAPIWIALLFPIHNRLGLS